MFRLRQSLIIKLISALILFTIPYEHCMRGMAYGFPFPWYHPNHEDWGGYVINPEAKFSDIIDFVNIVASLILWFIVNGIVKWVYRSNTLR